MSSPWMTPTVMIVLSAIRPQVSSLTQPAASSTLAKACVAPKFIARSRFCDRVDDDDVLGAGRRRALHGVHADAAGADDDDGLAGPDVGHLGRRAPAGGDAAADERGDVERDVAARS